MTREKGTNVYSVNIETKLSVVKPLALHARWLISFYDHMKTIATRAADVTKLRPPARLRQTNWRVLHIPVLSECKNGVFKQYFLETFNDFN